jgi:SpoVK/Ycf46/Vps4 family AAA+-type ATPase
MNGTGCPSAAPSPRRRLWRYSAFCRSTEEEEEEEITVCAVVRLNVSGRRRSPERASECVLHVPRRHRCSVYHDQYVRVTYSSSSDACGDCESSRRSVLARIQVPVTTEYHNNAGEPEIDDSVIYIDPLFAINLGCYDAPVALLSNSGTTVAKTVLRVQSMPEIFAAAPVGVTARNAVTLRLVSLPRRIFPGGANAHTRGADTLPPPLPPVGTLLQSSTLIGVASGHNVEYFYEVQIPTAKEEEEADDDDKRGTYSEYLVTTADTHFTVLGTETKNAAWAPLLPPVTTIHSPPGGAIVHPNARDLLREFWTMSKMTPSWRPAAAQCIWHLRGTRYEHDSTQLVETVAQQLGRSCLAVAGLAAAAVLYADEDDPPPVTTGGWVDKLQGLRCVLRRALTQAPSVLLLNRLDEEFTQSATRPVDESRLWNLIVETLTIPEASSTAASPWARTPPVIVVLMTREALPVGPIRQNLWHPSIPLALPDAAYIEYLWTNYPESESSFIPVNIEPSRKSLPMETVQQLLQGRNAGEILDIRREWLWSSQDDAGAALESLCQQRDDARRHRSGRIAPVFWSDVGGLEHVRREILDAIELPLQYPVLFGSARRSGILLYGPPGTGKTLVAKAVATECGVPFVSVKGPELLGSYVGESEAQVRSTFAQARRWALQNQPSACILFFDELDSIAPRRGDHAGSGGGAVMDRVVATLFAELDRGHDDGAFVFCMGATNRPDMLDPALLRPGRFDRLVYLGVSSTDYQNILVTHLRKLRLSEAPEAMVEILLPHLPPHLTGADLSTIASEALIRATECLCAEADYELNLLRLQQEEDGKELDVTLDDILSSWDEGRLEPVVTLEDLLEAARSVIPSVNAAELEYYEQIHQKYRQESHSVPVDPPVDGTPRALGLECKE